MSILQRQVVLSMLYSFLLTLLFLGIFLYVYPVKPLKELWDKEIMDIPFIVFVPTVSVLVGGISGAVIGYQWRKRLSDIGGKLLELERGKIVAASDKKRPLEIENVYEKMNKLQQHVKEQVTISQKLANERAEIQEKRVQEIVSQERNRLARELHDSVSQQLFAASMLMSAINENSSNENQNGKQLKLVEEMIHQSQLEMRALLLHLRPVPLKGKSLKEGMEELLVELIQKVPMNITWKIEEVKLDKGVEDQLFRILQESISNTLRHSKAETLEVHLVKREGTIIMIVSDDGVGFNVEASKAGSYGLQNMHERALEVGGILKIVSVINKGTRLEVKVPVIAKDENDEN
ncbi:MULTISPECIES: sensor histidine kinase [Bacillus]|uniref:sensor histidine kinase n=1 Tax=Bacillus TaxID=1386 RepID=UPI00030BCA39|nr:MULTISPECIES: sensor histidine kinase [Bacillus]